MQFRDLPGLNAKGPLIAVRRHVVVLHDPHARRWRRRSTQFHAYPNPTKGLGARRSLAHLGRIWAERNRKAAADLSKTLKGKVRMRLRESPRLSRCRPCSRRRLSDRLWRLLRRRAWTDFHRPQEGQVRRRRQQRVVSPVARLEVAKPKAERATGKIQRMGASWVSLFRVQVLVRLLTLEVFHLGLFEAADDLLGRAGGHLERAEIGRTKSDVFAHDLVWVLL